MHVVCVHVSSSLVVTPVLQYLMGLTDLCINDGALIKVLVTLMLV